MNRIERLQYQSALTVTGAWQGTNTENIYGKLGDGKVFLNEYDFEGSSKFSKFKIIEILIILESQ